MKFEFVEFYEACEATKKKRGNRCIGTLSIYLIDLEMDIRGIYVVKSGKSLFYHLPNKYGIDPETGKEVRYSVIGFTNQEKTKSLMDFLKNEVTPKIFKIIEENKIKNHGEKCSAMKQTTG